MFSLNSMDGDYYQAFGGVCPNTPVLGNGIPVKTFSESQMEDLAFLTKLYLGSLTLVGLFILFKCLD